MTDQEINIAIAELCGWRWVEAVNAPLHKWFRPNGTSDGKWSSGEKSHTELPSYVSDLNAMHEAEMTLTQSEQEQYICQFHTNSGGLYWQFLRMTARQRAEAFLRVKGLWK